MLAQNEGDDLMKMNVLIAVSAAIIATNAHAIFEAVGFDSEGAYGKCWDNGELLPGVVRQGPCANLVLERYAVWAEQERANKRDAEQLVRDQKKGVAARKSAVRDTGTQKAK